MGDVALLGHGEDDCTVSATRISGSRKRTITVFVCLHLLLASLDPGEEAYAKSCLCEYAKKGEQAHRQNKTAQG